jgi:subtilisin family serine protease
MKKSKIVLLVSVVFVFFLASSFDFPRFKRDKPNHLRLRRHTLQPFKIGQPPRVGDSRYAPDRVIVKFRPTLSIQSIDTTIGAYQAKKIKQIPILDIYLLEVPEYSTVEETAYTMSLNPDVEYVSPDYRTYITAVPPPSDSYFDIQYCLDNRGQEIGLSGVQGKSRADIRALEAWEETKGDGQVIIAVIDTGIDFDHPDLANTEGMEKISSDGYDFVNEDNDPTDDNGHGTFVSGLAAAKSNNTEGIAGVSWNSKILPIKAVESDGGGYVSWLTEAVRYAADNGADVISMSLGFSLGPNEEAPSLEDALQYASSKGIVLVASAGNEGSSVLYPAAYDDYCLAVAATDYNDDVPAWSNSGPEVDVGAPGVKLVSLVPTWYPGLEWGDFTLPPYAFADGTSASAAVVSGFVALIKSLKPWLEPEQIMDIVRYSADDINSDTHPGQDDYIGFGRINMSLALVPIKITGSK